MTNLHHSDPDQNNVFTENEWMNAVNTLYSATQEPNILLC